MRSQRPGETLRRSMNPRSNSICLIFGAFGRVRDRTHSPCRRYCKNWRWLCVKLVMLGRFALDPIAICTAEPTPAIVHLCTIPCSDRGHGLDRVSKIRLWSMVARNDGSGPTRSSAVEIMKRLFGRPTRSNRKVGWAEFRPDFGE